MKAIFPSRHGRRVLFFLALGFVLIWQPAGSSANIGNFNSQIETANSVKINDSPVFGEFDAWVGEFFNNKSDDEFIEKGEALAARRKRLFKELIHTDPFAAIRLAVDDEIRGRLPFSVTQHLENRVSFKGDLLIRVEDRTDLAGEEFTGSQIVREVVFDHVKYKAFVYGRKSSMTTKYDVPLSGVALDDLMALDENSVNEIAPAEYAARAIDPARVGADGAAAQVGGEIVYFSSRRELERYAS